MTRIIAGGARGVRMDVPAHGTRPTSDRVRESVFAAIESSGALADARVLDAYAGSGALGLESLSRGAQSADLVERGRSAAPILLRNASRVEHAMARSGAARVHTATIDDHLRRTGRTYDLVFLDPPYELREEELLGTLELLVPRLTPDALIVLERARRSGEPLWPAALERTRSRAYGDTTIWWAQPKPSSQSR